MKTRVIINPDGKTCTTLNPLGEEPAKVVAAEIGNGEFDVFENVAHKKWQQAEQERKTYEISYKSRVEWKCLCGWLGTKSAGNCWHCGTPKNERIKLNIDPGTEHEAEIIDGKAVIL